jgi:hypothetical protein
VTFAELIIAAVLLAGIYYLLRPVQRRLEHFLQRWLRKGSRVRPVIDITDYTKKGPK